MIVAILGLVCSVPCQFQRDCQREACRFRARICANRAEELTLMANHPAAWMGEFRPELRKRAAWAMEDSRRFSESSFYDFDEDERTTAANAIARGEKEFWARFHTAAALHGYRGPQVKMGRVMVWSIDGFLARSCPTYFLIIILAWTLWMTRRSRQLERVN